MSSAIVIRKYGYLSLVFFSVLLLSFVVYNLGNQLFEIKNIEVIGADVRVDVDENRIPKNLILFPADLVKEQILYDNPLIGDIVFQKKLPHTLIIITKSRIPVAVINSKDGPVTLDKNAVVLGAATSVNNLPRLQFLASTSVPGQKLTDQAVRTSLTFIDKTQLFMRLTLIESSGSAALLARSSNMNILIPQQGNIAPLLATLQTLIAGFRIKGTLPTTIDLRFDKPIVKF